MQKKGLWQKLMHLIGGKDVLAYSVTIFGSSMVGALMSSALSFFWTDVLLISTTSVGSIFLIAKIWDAVNDPMMGIIVDRTRTKWGKCIPYIRYVPIPLFIVSMLLFLPIAGWSYHYKVLYAGTCYILFYTCFTAVDIPINGLQPLLFTQQEQRNKAVSISSTLGSTGSILPGGLYFALVTLASRTGENDDPIAHFIVATVLVGIGCACMLISSHRLKEKIATPKDSTPFFQTIKPIFQNKPLFILLLVGLLSGPLAMSGNALVYFCNWNYADTNLDTAVLFPLLQISSGASWMLSILWVPALLKIFSKKRLFIIMCIAGAVLNLGLYFIDYQIIWLYLIFKFFAHFPAGIVTTLTTLMISDSIEYAEWRSGERTEGITFSITKLISKISGALISSLTMFMLAVVNYDPDAMKRTQALGQSISETYPDVLNMIYILMTLATALAFLLQMIPMFFYQFEGKFQQDVLAELEERRAAAAQTETVPK